MREESQNHKRIGLVSNNKLDIVKSAETITIEHTLFEWHGFEFHFQVKEGEKTQSIKNAKGHHFLI